jgi:CheY-like chemotaxis protein
VMCETISAMLEPLGFTVVCTDNGKSAVEYIAAELRASNRLAALIFDLTVSGGMGGREAITEIRKFASDIPAFVVSGYADDPVIRNPSEYGFNASICKPFLRTELLEMLEKHLPAKC